MSELSAHARPARRRGSAFTAKSQTRGRESPGPAQLFRAATLSNTEALGIGDRVGTVSVGKRASLLVLRLDPSATVDACSQIERVILRGRVLDPATLSAAAKPAARAIPAAR